MGIQFDYFWLLTKLSPSGRIYGKRHYPKDSHISSFGVSVYNFTTTSQQLSIYSDMQPIHQRGHFETWSFQRRLAWNKADCKLQPLGRTRA